MLVRRIVRPALDAAGNQLDLRFLAVVLDLLQPGERDRDSSLLDRKLVGAQVEIYNSSGELITSNSLQKRKMIIDFGEAVFGTYTIRLVKGAESKEFKYVKK